GCLDNRWLHGRFSDEEPLARPLAHALTRCYIGGVHHHHEPLIAHRFHKALRHPLGPHVVRREVIVPGLDPAHDGLRIAQLSDLHVGMLTSERKIRRAIHRAAAERPDLTVLTGDYLCYSPKFLGQLRELIVEVEGPAVAVLGNHDYWTDGEGVRKVFEHAGINVLRNQHTQLQFRH